MVISPLSASRGAALVWLSARLQAVMGSFGPQILAHALPTALVLFTCPLRSDLKRTPLAGRGRWAEVKYDHCQANSRRRGLKCVAAARGRRAAWSEQSFAFARVLAKSTNSNTIEEAGRALLSLHKVCSAPQKFPSPPPTSPPTSHSHSYDLAQRPFLVWHRLLPVLIRSSVSSLVLRGHAKRGCQLGPLRL